MGRHVRWLHGQLPHLVASGVLSAEAADRLRAHYGPPVDRDLAARIGLVVFGVFGATLIGAGVILLVAHNWEDLGIFARSALSVGVLVVAQLFTGWVAWARPGSVAWSESAASLLLLALGACLALISQTFHLSGTLDAFLWTWLLLALPALWLLEARFATALWLAGTVGWAGAAGDDTPWHLLWLAGALPLGLTIARAGLPTGRDHLFGWSLVLALLTTTLSLGGYATHLWVIWPVGLLGLLVASATLPGVSKAWSVPARTLAVPVLAGLALAHTFEGAWPRHFVVGTGAGLVAVVLGSVALALATARGAWLLGEGRHGDAALPLLPALLLVGLPFSALAPVLAAGWMNLVVLAVGGWLLADGLRSAALGRTNGGIALLGSLLALRFFDADVPTLVRAVAFIALGIAFLGVNVRLLAARREHP